MADILAALDTICNASDASLQKYRDKLGQLLARTASLLGRSDKLDYKPDSDPTCGPSQNSTPIPRICLLAAHDDQAVVDSMDARAEPYIDDGAILPVERQATGCKEEKRIQHVTELLDVIEKKLPEIQKAYENGASNFSYPISTAEDSRVLDFTICDGTKGKRSMNMRIQRTLSILSLTNEFVAWDCLTFKQSKVVRQVNVLSEKTDWTGNINKFLNKHGIIDKKTAKKMISEGIKSLVIQALSGIPGIAALLLARSRWHEIPYMMLPTLIEGLLDRKIYGHAEVYSDWWESCQENYNNGSRRRKLMIRKCHPSQYPSVNRTKRRRIERNEGHRAEGHGDQNYILEPNGSVSSEFGHSFSQTKSSEPQIFTTASLPNAICENLAVSQSWEPVEVDVDGLSNRSVAEGDLDQTIDNEFVPRTTEPSARPNISPVVDSGGSGNMDNPPLPHALGYNAPPKSVTTVELPADHRRNLVEDTAQNAVGRSFSASLQLVPTTSTAETYMPYTDYWATQPDDIGTSSAETYMPCTDYWATQPDDIGTSSAETYMPCTDYWATQPDDIGTSSAETYMPCTDYWVTQSGGLDTETHMFDTEILTTTASQPQLNMVNIRGNGGVHSHGHNNGSLQSHHTSSFRSEACNA
ncbi:conserved hypothetical protein [Histoplasma capsulatum var. duboisii H88]|uniref:Uncharacterized protein n=3 Tax=Ajellomyces capsulatus TaxID=5037 RepID=F0UHU3_AJEC8|nr:conserved hypothetical protein [Histoplasma capsulatum H143]EGC45452.1 conserved hypothetical protein [Histoplasma capsulatum var. duboisii H88]